jgi:ClpP class serine protease
MFIGVVRTRRGDKLTGPDKTLFSGEYWTASTALSYGLIDRLGDLRSYLRELYGEEVFTPLISAERGLFGRRIPGVAEVETFARPGFAEEIASAIEARAMWARYGL